MNDLDTVIYLLQGSQLHVNDYIRELHTVAKSSIKYLHCKHRYGKVHTTLQLCSLVSLAY